MERNFHILIVEDDLNDAFLLVRALRKIFSKTSFHLVRDGLEAIQYLAGEGAFSDRFAYPWPDLVMTDLKMPRVSGFQLLEWLQRHRRCRLIPCVVLSSSDTDKDILQAYEMGASGYLAKTSNTDLLAHMLRVIRDYWTLNLRPRTELPQTTTPGNTCEPKMELRGITPDIPRAGRTPD